MNATRRSGSRTHQPRIEVGKSHLFDPHNEDWYTPKVFRLHPLEVRVEAGERGNRARVNITEGEYERRHVMVAIVLEEGKVPCKDSSARSGFDSYIDNDFGGGASGPFTVEQIDNLIEALTVARREAAKHGLFTPRSTPKTISEIEVPVG